MYNVRKASLSEINIYKMNRIFATNVTGVTRRINTITCSNNAFTVSP